MYKTYSSAQVHWLNLIDCKLNSQNNVTQTDFHREM